MTEPTIAEEAAAIMAENGDEPTDMWAHYRAVNTVMKRRGLLLTGGKVAEPKLEEENDNEQNQKA